jgi:hypothetical protein
MMMTVSFFRNLAFFITALPERANDPHELLLAQLSGHGAEDARADRLAFGRDQDGGVVVEADVRAVPAPVVAPRPHDHRPDHALAVLLDEGGIGRGFLDGGRDDVPQARVLPRRAPAHADAGDPARPGVVRHLEDGAHLNHRPTPS